MDLTPALRAVWMQLTPKDHAKACKAIAAHAMTPKTLTPAGAAKLRAMHATVDVFTNGPGASLASFLTLAGVPLTFAEHAARMALSESLNA